MLGKDYRVLERIGTGGMAVVYLVEHQTLLKRFAAKVLSTEHAKSAEARARFTQEAHAASQLDHENIVTISDFGISSDARPYFVMELLRGKTLAERLDEGPMSLGEVVAVTVPVARALAHAHAEGIIHRDVKPENIYLVQRTQGRWGVKVLDFGIARVPFNDRMTKTGQALGSPMFMAPEACRGEEVDERADIYSFGVVLYMMLTGRAPFEDENLLKVLQMQVSAPLPPPRSLNANIPPAIEAVVVRALAKDPADRFPSMEALLYDFEAALPDGSDELLILAQFGTGHTPFPGSLDRVRTSQRMQRISVSPADTTGQHSVSPATLRSVSLPTAPSSRRRTPLVLGLLLVTGAGAGGYAWLQHSKSTEPAMVAAGPETPVATTPPPATKTVTNETATAPAPTPIATAEVPVADAVPTTDAEPTAVEQKPEEVDAAPARKAKAQNHPRPVPKRVAAASAKEPAKQPAAVASAVTVAAPDIPPAAETVVPKPSEPPAQPPPPVAAPAPAPIPTKPPPAVNVGSLDATPSITRLDVEGSLPSSIVRRTVERALPALRDCYHAAASTQRKTPAVTLSLSFEIDESRATTNVSVRGGTFGSLGSCAKSALTRLQTQQAPDVGTVQVSVAVRFTPS